MNGTDLLAEFRENRSETAFRELVRHYTNLVYSVAKRRLWNVSLAQEVTQLVFIRLANAAPKIRTDAQLAAWLHRTTVHVAIDLWRSESRRHAREELAAAMQQSDYAETVTWSEIAPALDEALDKLTDSDREVILLRFFDSKSMRDVGQTLGISEDAAKMRVSRAIERLRGQLSSQGVTCTALALATMLVEHSVEAAPASLVAILALLKVPVPAGAAATGGILGSVLNASKMQVAAGITALLFGGIAIVLLRSTNPASV